MQATRRQATSFPWAAVLVGIVVGMLGPHEPNWAGMGFSYYYPGAFFIFIFKKTKFQKYMPNMEIFKNGCLSPIKWATGPKCKKIYF